MRLLYVSRSAGVHDTRFVEAWQARGVEVRSLQITADSEEADAGFLDVVTDFRPDAVQVGPITSPGPLVARLWHGPLIVVSWAFDLLLEVGESDDLRDAAREVLRRADVVFVDSAAVRDEAVALGAEPDAIVTFPWGIAPEWVARRPAARSGRDPFVFLSTRRHEDLYRVVDTVSAFLAAAGELPGAELWVAGSGSLTPLLRELAEQGGAGDRVRFLGERSGAALSELYARADVYLSSTVVDGTSVSLLEAMASGALPLVSDIAGNREWVGAEIGIRYPLGDVGELAALMLRSAALSPRERKSMADAAFDLVRERANWDATTARFTDHLALAIDRHDSRGREGADMVGNVERLAIGTAQFGMAYGVANASGQLSVDAARSVLDVARASGIDTIDTAVAYGASQRTLGEIGVEGLRVVTKLPAFTGSEDDIPSWVSGTVAAALRELDVTSVYGLMFHHAGDLAGVHGEAFHREALRLRESGLVERLGVSVYGPDELEAVDKYELDLVQAPYNVVDQRVASSGWLDRLVDRGVEVHTRSVFLQGLLLMAPAQRPDYFARWAAEFGTWDRWCVEQGVAPLEAALGFVLGDSRIDRVLVGIDSPAQLQQIVAAAREVQHSQRFDGLGIDDPALVNPSSWKV